jgi:hypothetical protein
VALLVAVGGVVAVLVGSGVAVAAGRGVAVLAVGGVVADYKRGCWQLGAAWHCWLPWAALSQISWQRGCRGSWTRRGSIVAVGGGVAYWLATRLLWQLDAAWHCWLPGGVVAALVGSGCRGSWERRGSIGLPWAALY